MNSPSVVSPEHQVAVRVCNLIVDYGELRAVSDVSFDAVAGCVTAVLGPNGAGKTTTMEVCSGARNPTTGSVRVLGLDPRHDRLKINSKIGVMLQEGGVYPSVRVEEVLHHYCNLYNNQKNVNDLLDAVDLGAKRKTTWRRLSGGEKQRLSLALALAANPQVAFLDEPTSGVDIIGRDLIRDIIRNLAKSGCAVLLATHELDEAERVADQVVMFQRGKLIANSSMSELRGNSQVITVRSSGMIDTVALGRHMNCQIESFDQQIHLFVQSDPTVITRLSAWFSQNSLPIDDLRVGLPRLEDIYRQLTTAQIVGQAK